MKRHILSVLLLLPLVSLLFSCGTVRQERELSRSAAKVSLTLSREQDFLPDVTRDTVARRDTFTVQDGERTLTIMRAVQDENGEMVAHDVLDAAVVTARFRNVAERHGEVEIEFTLTIPEKMRNNRWQLRFFPKMIVLGDTLDLEKVIVTGSEYRRRQLRGYEQYERFLRSLITDPNHFINFRLLEIFIERNIPQLWAFRTEMRVVTDEEFASAFGVTERQAVEHYTNKISKWFNDRRIAQKQKMYRRYVKVPIARDGIRLDTVLMDSHGDFVYNYREKIRTRPKLRKVDVIIDGEVYEEDRLVYDIPQTDPLTFYISSISSFVDNTEKYLTKVIERRVEANTACYVAFASGSSTVDLSLDNNAEEIGRIKGNLSSLMQDVVFDLDSIVVTSAASPEGSQTLNRSLSLRRSEAISAYLKGWMRHYADSLDAQKGFSVDENGKVVKADATRTDFPFVSRSIGENWDMLDHLIERDTVLTDAQKHAYRQLEKTPDKDVREQKMRSLDSYTYLRQSLYPRLRTVRFDFHLHRKGMVKDTVHTTVLDSTYMRGVQAIRDRDYETALTLLRPYDDYNTAIAYVSLDYNASAMKILRRLEPTPQVNYMLAVLYSRKGDDRKAVEHYVRACSQEPSYKHRGNLDPEISVLIKRYSLNREEEPETDFY